VLLPFWDDCQAALGDGADMFTELIVECRAAAAAAGVQETGRAPYVIDTAYEGASFMDDKWDYFTDPDPTAGCVRYVDEDEAATRHLVEYDSATDQTMIRTDTTNVHFDCAGDGRPSVRVASKKIWHSGGLFVVDLDHMPTGCATWPAFWLVAAPCGASGNCAWPIGGEIDIIEGANEMVSPL
jgi:hypothetical protein